MMREQVITKPASYFCKRPKIEQQKQKAQKERENTNDMKGENDTLCLQNDHLLVTTNFTNL
jgi:hypothetical protein